MDKSYRLASFGNDRERMESLFALYEKLVAPLAAAPRSRRAGRKTALPPAEVYTQAQADAAHQYFVMEEPAKPA